MKVILERVLPDTALSKFRIADMRHNDTITAYCDTAAEFKNAHVNAVRGAKEIEREDGFEYKIQTLSTENKVIVSLIKRK